MLQELKLSLTRQGLASIVGLGFALAWIYAPFLSDYLFYLFFHTGFALTLLILAVFYRLRPHATPWTAFPWIASVFMCASALSVWVIGPSTMVPHCICALLGGIGSSYLFASWFFVYSASSIKHAVNTTLLAFAFSSTVRFVLVLIYSIIPAITFVILMVVPFASSLLLARSMGASLKHTSTVAAQPVPAVAPESATVRQSWWSSMAIVALELVAYGVVFGILRNGINEWATSTPSMLVGHLLRIFLPLLLFWWLAVRTRNEPHDGLLRGSLLLLAFVLLAGIFFGGAGPILLSAIVLVARSLVSIIIYARLFDALQHSTLHPCAVYGIGRGVYELSLVGGLLTYEQLLGRMSLDGIPFDIVYFAVACVVMLLLSSFTATLSLSSLKVGEEPVEKTRLGIEECCARTVERFGLSEREAQVLPFVVKGHTKKHIAEVLCLSEDTIRYHTKQLYRKLDVHSRQELLLKVGID